MDYKKIAAAVFAVAIAVLGLLSIFNPQPPWQGLSTGAAVNITAVLGAGINAIDFRPTRVTSQNVQAVNQSSGNSLFIVSNPTNSTANATMSVSPFINGFVLKCAPNYNQSGIVSLNTSAQSVANVPNVSNGNTTCYQESVNVSTLCGGLGNGTYSANKGNWSDADWSTYVIVSAPGGAYLENYSLSSYVVNSTVQIKYGSTTTNLTTQNCSNNTSTMQMKYDFVSASVGNGSDGTVTWTSGTKSFGNMVAGTDYTNTSTILYLKLNRPYNFVNFTLGPGMTVTANNTTGNALVLLANSTMNISGLINLTLANVNVSNGYVHNGINFSLSAGSGGDGANTTNCLGSGLHYLGWGGGGCGGSSNAYGFVPETPASGGTGGTSTGVPGTGGANVSLPGADSIDGNPGVSGGGGSGSVSAATGSGGTSNAASGTGGSGNGGSGNNGISSSAHTAAGGGGGSGGFPGNYTPSLYMAARVINISGNISLAGKNGSNGGNGGNAATTGTARADGGSGGGGGGGSNGGNLYLYMQTLILNASHVNLAAGLGVPGGSGGTGSGTGGVPGGNGAAGTNGVNGTISNYTTGLTPYCYYNGTWRGIVNVYPVPTAFYETAAYLRVLNQPGQAFVWCWADFNVPNPVTQSYTIDIEGVDA